MNSWSKSGLCNGFSPGGNIHGEGGECLCGTPIARFAWNRGKKSPDMTFFPGDME